MKLSYLYGARFSDWVKLLLDNGFRVHPRYLHRAALITASSLMTSLLGSIEHLRHGRAVDETEVEPSPLFILGHWRSGTAYLQNLLASDPGLATPNVYQTFSPHTFLSWGKISSRILEPFLPPTRGFDNMDLHLRAPEEDEFALAIAGSCSLYLGMMFPRHESVYRRYLTLAELTPEELEHWKSTFLWFLKKLTCLSGRPLILRSPPHTARVRVLLDLFPRARFVHIYRHPWRVFQSCRHFYSYMYQHVAFLQRPDLAGLDERIIDLHREMYDAFERDQPLIDRTR
ncbi:sulfotransferase, partial [Gemmatimonadota bacterium]